MAPDDPTEALNLLNAGYVADVYEQYRRDPGSVDAEWRALFDSGASGFEPVGPGPQAGPTNGNPVAEAPAADAPVAAAPEAEAPSPQAPPADVPKPGVPKAEAAASVPDGATPIKGPAARLAQNMAASLGVPTATTFREIDVATLEARRKELNGQIAPRKVSFTHLIGWAIVRAANDQRAMSHYFREFDGQAYRVDPQRINLGLAVDVERKDGSRFLVVPVIKAADAMDFAAFHARYEELVEPMTTPVPRSRSPTPGHWARRPACRG